MICILKSCEHEARKTPVMLFYADKLLHDPIRVTPAKIGFCLDHATEDDPDFQEMLKDSFGLAVMSCEGLKLVPPVWELTEVKFVDIPRGVRHG